MTLLEQSFRSVPDPTTSDPWRKHIDSLIEHDSQVKNVVGITRITLSDRPKPERQAYRNFHL